jgi:hypothetical protein
MSVHANWPQLVVDWLSLVSKYLNKAQKSHNHHNDNPVFSKRKSPHPLCRECTLPNQTQEHSTDSTMPPQKDGNTAPEQNINQITFFQLFVATSPKTLLLFLCPISVPGHEELGPLDIFLD